MTTNEYLEKSKRTNKTFPEGRFFTPKEMDLLHAAMGMVTESSEFMDMLKKYLIYGKELDEVNLNEEIGDKLWYIALALRTLNSSFEEVMGVNIEKLEARYPEKFFLEENAINRDLNKERKILENGHLK